MDLGITPDKWHPASPPQLWHLGPQGALRCTPCADTGLPSCLYPSYLLLSLTWMAEERGGLAPWVQLHMPRTVAKGITLPPYVPRKPPLVYYLKRQSADATIPATAQLWATAPF